jgi:protein-S-isoprenylcysteine O-methyltransferase Ste14
MRDRGHRKLSVQMMRATWILRHAFAIVILPVTMTILIPWWVIRGSAIVFRMPSVPLDWLCIVVGVLLFAAGFVLFVATVFLFATRGRGTLAPWDPPSRLVVDGPYRYVRNPMIAGVILVITAESLVFRSLSLAEWAAAFFVINAIYFPLLEEPQLEGRFGEQYRHYKRHVRRFIPRFRPWSGA